MLMKLGKALKLVIVAAAVAGLVPSFVGAAERVVLGEYFTQLD